MSMSTRVCYPRHERVVRPRGRCHKAASVDLFTGCHCKHIRCEAAACQLAARSCRVGLRRGLGLTSGQPGLVLCVTTRVCMCCAMLPAATVPVHLHTCVPCKQHACQLYACQCQVQLSAHVNRVHRTARADCHLEKSPLMPPGSPT